jgi:hypothetical protein
MKKRVFFGILAVLTALCIIGCDDGKDDDKDKNKATEFEGKILKVTDIPANVTIIAAALITDLNAQTPSPEVSGFNELDGTTGTFNLHEATPNWVPDTTKPWKDSGSYYLILAASMSPTDPQYHYTAGKEILEFNIDGFKAAVQADIDALIASMQQQGQGGASPGNGIGDLLGQNGQPDQQKVATYIQTTLQGLGNNTVKQNMTKYDFTVKTSTLAWDQFKLLDQSTIEEDAATLLSAPATQTQIQAALTELLTAMQTQLAALQQQGG